jgi:hypothetical protein
MSALADMPADEFRAALKKGEPHFHGWWSRGEIDNLKRAIEPFITWQIDNVPNSGLDRGSKAIAKLATVRLPLPPGISDAVEAITGRALNWLLRPAASEMQAEAWTMRVVEYARVARHR